MFFVGGNHCRYWRPHFEFNEFHISFNNLGQIFHELRSHAREEFRVCVRPARETLLGGEWIVHSLRELPPRFRVGENCPPPGRAALAQPGGEAVFLNNSLVSALYERFKTQFVT